MLSSSWLVLLFTTLHCFVVGIIERVRLERASGSGGGQNARSLQHHHASPATSLGCLVNSAYLHIKVRAPSCAVCDLPHQDKSSTHTHAPPPPHTTTAHLPTRTTTTTRLYRSWWLTAASAAALAAMEAD